MPLNTIGEVDVNQQIEPVRWGVLGVANIATTKVIPAMQASELSPVGAIASRSLERAERAAGELGINSAYGSYDELLADPAIEAVYIPLPNHLHLEWAQAAARAGKHVLCEKPLAMTSAEARAMVETCEEAGVLLMEAFMYRLHPLWLKAKELIDGGAIGELRSVQTAFSYFNDDPSNIRNIPEVGGGALYDIGCYAVNAARFLFGTEPMAVKGAILRDPDLGTDVVTSAVLDFGSGQSTFFCSTQMEPDQRVDIHGTNGRIVIEIPFNIPPDIPTRLLLVSGGDPPVSPDVEIHEVPPENPYASQADAFSTAIRTGSPAPVPSADGVANLEVMERIFADAAS
jgi:predicted dehydrogenase